MIVFQQGMFVQGKEKLTMFCLVDDVKATGPGANAAADPTSKAASVSLIVLSYLFA